MDQKTVALWEKIADLPQIELLLYEQPLSRRRTGCVLREYGAPEPAVAIIYSALALSAPKGLLRC
jgi:hypothetical protein